MNLLAQFFGQAICCLHGCTNQGDGGVYFVMSRGGKLSGVDVMKPAWFQFVVMAGLVSSGLSCGSSATPTKPDSANTTAVSTAESKSATPDGQHEKPAAKRRTIARVEIGAGSNSGSTPAKSMAEQIESVRSALKPFQILLGSWKGLSQKTISDQPQWAYDWVSDPKFPGLKIVSEKGAYIRNGRLSYLPESDQFELKAKDAEGTERTFRGTFIEPIRDVATDEKKLQRTYKLQLTEPEANSSGEQWRITFNQQENNRYILEIDRKRGSGPFSRVDTVHTQREGTSFALSETDYGDKTCIISQGLGTISVSYKGQSYWVCCSGCKAAFEDEPEKWIAKWEEKKKSMTK